MRRALVICALAAIGLAASGARAQREDAGASRIRTQIERAPAGSLRRGSVDVPEWVALGGGAVVAVGAAGALLFLAWRRRR